MLAFSGRSSQATYDRVLPSSADPTKETGGPGARSDPSIVRVGHTGRRASPFEDALRPVKRNRCALPLEILDHGVRPVAGAIQCDLVAHHKTAVPEITVAARNDSALFAADEVHIGAKGCANIARAIGGGRDHRIIGTNGRNRKRGVNCCPICLTNRDNRCSCRPNPACAGCPWFPLPLRRRSRPVCA